MSKDSPSGDSPTRGKSAKNTYSRTYTHETHIQKIKILETCIQEAHPQVTHAQELDLQKLHDLAHHFDEKDNCEEKRKNLIGKGGYKCLHCSKTSLSMKKLKNHIYMKHDRLWFDKDLYRDSPSHIQDTHPHETHPHETHIQEIQILETCIQKTHTQETHAPELDLLKLHNQVHHFDETESFEEKWKNLRGKGEKCVDCSEILPSMKKLESHMHLKHGLTRISTETNVERLIKRVIKTITFRRSRALNLKCLTFKSLNTMRVNFKRSFQETHLQEPHLHEPS